MTEYEIHPAIGVARVGSSRLSSEEGFFIGPEPGGSPPANYRDSAGDLKRQAARFRVFACRRDEKRRLLEATELTLPAVKSITWTTHLANRKGVARRQYGPRPGFRNRATGRDDLDRALIIDPGPRTVRAPGERQFFDTGRFRTTLVPLGEIAMGPDGRLLVLGGHGRSGSGSPQPRLDLKTGHFADNDDWYDDVADGPVTATIELPDGAVAQATAWVVVGPPDFAPGITNLITLYHQWFRSGADNVLPLTTCQYAIMLAWAAGDFINDLGRSSDAAEPLPDALDRTALEGCVGAPLYPGVEVTGHIMNFPERTEHLGDVPRSRRVDVVVLGGGPAGTAAALALARSGRAVTVMERDRYESSRVGETLPPDARRPLVELGVWKRFPDDGHLESPGTATAWGRPDLYHNDFIVNPHGPGWHVDRGRFDAMLAHAAESAGAEVLRGAWPTVRAEKPGTAWHVAAVDGDARLVRYAKVLVDATGRSPSPVRHLGGHRLVYDRLVGLLGLVPARVAARCRDRRTLVEAVETGWWYTAPLPDGRRTVAFMTDGDLVPRGGRERTVFRLRQLERAPHTRACLGPDAFDAEPRVVNASSSRSARAAGAGWLAVGDAAASFDPLSQQGVTWALESGLEAARAVDAHLRGGPRALDRYAGWVADEFAAYLQTRALYYARELRWPDFPFWKRRHMPAGAVRHGSRNPPGSRVGRLPLENSGKFQEFS